MKRVIKNCKPKGRQKGQKDKQRSIKHTQKTIKIEQHEPHWTPGMYSGAPEVLTVPVLHVTSDKYSLHILTPSVKQIPYIS